MRRIGLGLLAIIVLGAVGVGAVLWHAATAPLPDHDQDVTVQGLEAPVEIRRDEWGVPHLYARSLSDLVFAQGFVHAQDRWWTMEFYRRVARGELAALIGPDPDAIENDTLMRALGITELARRDWEALDGRTRMVVEAFTAGINAYLETRSPQELAAEYRLLGLAGIAPQVTPWRPEDSLAIGKVMGFSLSGRDIGKELTRAAVAARVSPAMYEQWFAPYRYDLHPTVIKMVAGPAPQDPPSDDAVPAETVPEEEATLRPRDPGPMPRVLRNAWLRALPGQQASHGSNAWVVSGAHTVSGQPLVAVDSHLGIEIPNVWHEIGLHLRPDTGEAIDITGFAAAPFFLVLEGNNNHAAWGTTNVTGGDSLDLYELRINPNNPNEYEWDGAWRAMTVAPVEIAVGGAAAPHRTVVRRTHFGPVLPRGADEAGPVYAIRWGGFGISRIARASARLPFIKTFEDMQDALRDWDYPPTNFFFAGRNGDIGFQEAGRFPVRAEGRDGRVPQPGWTSAAQWIGTVPYELMPAIKNPPSGILVSGNNPPVPPAYFDRVRAVTGGDPNFLKDGARGFRAARIEERLAAEGPHDLDSFAAIQTDVTVFGLAASMPVIVAQTVDAAAEPCRATLAAWDGAYTRDSAGALVFAHLWAQILDTVYAPHLGPGVPPTVGMNELLSLQTILEDPDSGWWDHPDTTARETRDARLIEALSATCAAVTARFGANPSAWRWDGVHEALFVHPIFGNSGLPVIENWANAGPFVAGGGAGTVSVGRWNHAGGTYRMRHIPSYRRLTDVADFSKTRSINSVGQSSHPASDHYADQAPLWAQGRYKAVSWTQPQVDAATRSRQWLRPAEE